MALVCFPESVRLNGATNNLWNIVLWSIYLTKCSLWKAQWSRRGNFNSGFCTLGKNKHVTIVNKSDYSKCWKVFSELQWRLLKPSLGSHPNPELILLDPLKKHSLLSKSKSSSQALEPWVVGSKSMMAWSSEAVFSSWKRRIPDGCLLFCH